MGFWEKLDKFNLLIEGIQDWFDDSPLYLRLSYDKILREKIKAVLKKYALYDEVNMMDECFKGFGILRVEFVGKEGELEDFKIIVEKIVFDYMYSYYLDFTRTKMDTQKIGENMYVVIVYYYFSKKTWRNFQKYFDEISNHNKQEVLTKEIIIDDELEREMEKWNI